jgi:hypothetical protein
MPGTGDPHLDAILSHIGSGGGAAQNTGPSAANALGGNYVDGKVPMVYWGQGPVVEQTGGRDSERDDVIRRLGIKPATTAKELTVQDAVADWYKWSDQERSAFGQRLYKLGLVKDPHDYGAVFNTWQSAVQEASNFYSFAGKKVTPWQVLDVVAGGANGPRPSTHVEKNFSIPTVEDAHAATKQLFQALMGRDPDHSELDRYASMMTSYAQKHPKITKTVTDIHGNNTVTNSGGVSDAALGDVLSNQAKADPEYGSYQAATTYFNALIGSLGGLGGGNG